MGWKTKEQANTYFKKYRANRKTEGICRACGKQAKQERTLCQVCMDKVGLFTKASRLNNPMARAVREAKRRSIKNSVPFNMVLKDLYPLPIYCPVLGLKLNYGAKELHSGPLPNSPSLDRIIPNLGYVTGNVVVISNRANTIKQNATSDELFKVATWLKGKEDATKDLPKRGS